MASETDDAALRNLLRETPMDGPVRITLRREPNFFRAAALEGPIHQTLVVRDAMENRIVGMGTRSVRLRYIHGEPTPVGYLGGLRLRPEARSGMLLARGYRALRQLHDDGATEFYLTTIAQENRQALDSLTAGRAGLPTYREIGVFFTLVLPLAFPRSWAKAPSCDVRPLGAHELPQFLEFLEQAGGRRAFFPCYTSADFVGDRRTFLDLLLENILVARRGDEMLGALGAWDQSGLRQTVVEGYSPALRWFRPAFNAVARWRGWPRFPVAGQPFRALVAALPVVNDDDPRVFQALCASLATRSRQQGRDSLLLGLGRNHPLFPLLRRRALFTYATRVYLVYWDPPSIPPERLAPTDPYLELGCL